MVLDSLGSSIQESLSNLRGKSGTLSEEDINPIVKEIQKSLLESDVEVETVSEVSDNIKDRSLNNEMPAGVTAKDHVLNIVYEELKSIVGESTDIPLDEQTILLAGLQGSGKTTTSAKIGWWFEKKGLRSGIIQTDTQRPGAHDQSRQLAEEAGIKVYTNEDSENPLELAQNGLDEINEADVKIVDTAGRHASEDELIDEIENISDNIDPDLKILVLDGSIGQSARKQAEKFNDAIGVDGIIITKMDGSAKGGGAITAVHETDSTIAFLGTGEGVKDIERFNRDGFISDLLGMGDLKQLSERVERAMHEMEDDDWEPEDVLEGEFTLYDMKKQMEAMNNMGRMGDIISKVPGISGMMDQIDDDLIENQEQMMKKYSIIMDSMTEKEMTDPTILNESRIHRISRGSGTKPEDVEQMITQYNQMKSMMSQIDGKQDIQNMADKFGSGGGIGPF